MSNGLADASFFPTAKELSTGLRWFKDHPVLAAAAATAVSVITYLNATDALASTECDGYDDDDSDGGGVGNDDEEEEDGENDDDYYRNSSTSTSSSRRRRDAEDEGDGKLSTAVSWGDERGGSLTQVFEHSDESDEEPARAHYTSNSNRGGGGDRHRANGSSSAQPAAGDTGRPLAAARPVVGAIRKSATLQSIASGVLSPDGAPRAPNRLAARRDDESSVTISPGGELDLQTESPQWGWYVAITPPQDHLHASLPRVALLPPPPHRTHNASSGIGRPTTRVDVGATSTLRRSASGRIP